eukprot:2282469-Rhodomonas_salina.3
MRTSPSLICTCDAGASRQTARNTSRMLGYPMAAALPGSSRSLASSMTMTSRSFARANTASSSSSSGDPACCSPSARFAVDAPEKCPSRKKSAGRASAWIAAAHKSSALSPTRSETFLPKLERAHASVCSTLAASSGESSTVMTVSQTAA